MGSAQIQWRIERILEYMEPYWEFANCHMVNYLTHRHWERYVPEALRREVPDSHASLACIEDVFWGEAAGISGFPSFARFVAEANKCRVDNCRELLTSTEDLCRRLRIANLQPTLSIKEFMTEKKGHEVETTAELVHQLIANWERPGELIVVDAGDGKGYLSSRLALQYGHRVVGLDCKESNTKSAIDRGRKLRRVWNGLVAKANSGGGAIPTAGRESAAADPAAIPNYSTVAKFITPDLNVAQLIADQLGAPAGAYGVCVVGLHTCGNLAPSCLRLFDQQSHCQLLCNIGCCYHLLSERYAEDTLTEMDIPCGFPLSAFLNTKRTKLGRNARMLAAQSIERTLAARQLPNVSLFHRALLETLLVTAQNGGDSVKVGKIRKYEGFADYVQKSGLASLVGRSAHALADWEAEHEAEKRFLDLFYLLRMTFAPVVESLILLDRLLYLRECGHADSHCVPLFDAVISPRRFAIIAIKKD